MASACLSPEMTSSYSWFNPHKKISDLQGKPDPVPESSDLAEFDGFEFCLEDPATMLPADELFLDGKLVPLQMTVKCERDESATSSGGVVVGAYADTCPDTPCVRRIRGENNDVFSPRAPKCSSRWKELLGFGGSGSGSGNNNNKHATSLASSNRDANGTARTIRQLLQRNSKASSIDASVNVPLLDNNEGGVTISSRASLSSSSSSSNHSLEEMPRLSLDSDKPKTSTKPKTRMVKTRPDQPRVNTTRGVKSTTRRTSDACEARVTTIDSPRMNSSGKIVFQHLERSSSSPSTFNGGPRYKHRGVIERSYSANVRITNVPLCSLRGSSSKSVFGFPIFSQQKQQQQRGGDANNVGNVTNRSQRFNGGKSRTDNGLGQS